MRKFNQKYEDSPNVSYFWIAGTGRNGFRKTSYIMLPTYTYLQIVTQEDNVVQ